VGEGVRHVRSRAALRRNSDDAEAARLVRESFVSLLEGVPGFIAYYWIDAGKGVMASLSLFESREGADKSVEIARGWVAENAPTLFPNPPRVTEGPVVASAAAS